MTTNREDVYWNCGDDMRAQDAAAWAGLRRDWEREQYERAAYRDYAEWSGAYLPPKEEGEGQAMVGKCANGEECWAVVGDELEHPCEYGHYDCSYFDHGPCHDQHLGERHDPYDDPLTS